MISSAQAAGGGNERVDTLVLADAMHENWAESSVGHGRRLIFVGLICQNSGTHFVMEVHHVPPKLNKEDLEAAQCAGFPNCDR
jgi:hypothetical protein